jgi:hypothetical protein
MTIPETIHSIVSNVVPTYANIAPESATEPFCVFTYEHEEIHTKQGKKYDDCTVTLHLYATDQTTAEAKTELIIEAVENNSNEQVKQALHQESTLNYIQDITRYIAVSEFRMIIQDA